MTRVNAGAAPKTAGVEPPKPSSVDLARRVFEVAARDPDPRAVLALGSTESAQKGYRVLASRLHPDRAAEADKPQVEEGFKLAKAAWEACPANPDYSTTAASFYAEECAKAAKGARPASSGPSAAPRASTPKADQWQEGPGDKAAREAHEAFMRAQAEAAAKAAEAAKKSAEAQRESALANARMSLGGTATALSGGLEKLAKGLERTPSAAVVTKVGELAARVAKIPLDLGPKFSAAAPDARVRLEAFKEETVGGLRRAREALPELSRALEGAKAGQAKLTEELTQLRRAHSLARNNVEQLRQWKAPKAEIDGWEDKLEVQGEAIDELANALRNETRTIAEAERQLQKLSASVPYLERQVWDKRVVQYAEAGLGHTFNLQRAPFGADEVEWTARIGLIEKGLGARLETLELDALRSIANARNGMPTSVRTTLGLILERQVQDAAILQRSLSDDVRGALSPELRARTDGLLQDLAKLGAAYTERPRQGAAPLRQATKVEGLATKKLEAAWNQQVQFGLDAEKARSDAIWATRDPNKFY